MNARKVGLTGLQHHGPKTIYDYLISLRQPFKMLLQSHLVTMHYPGSFNQTHLIMMVVPSSFNSTHPLAP